MKKIYKDMELSSKALGAAIFMATVCLYMGIGAINARISGVDFNYYIPFAFLIHGVIISLMVSGAWILCFGMIKAKGFVFRYLLTLIIMLVLYGITFLFPVIISKESSFIWVISSFVSALLFLTGVSALNEMQLKKTGVRSVLLWELK